MRLRNRSGTPVDPVPFLVVEALVFLLCYSCGPIYLLTFGVELPGALAVTTVVFLGATAGAYHTFVWTVKPELKGEVPATLRLRKIILAVLVVGGIVTLLSLPLLGRL
ncbi:hypothetical protein [Halorussus halophilus]|uniref:hypothetical protein n=1 Tax=Halorussus halophilus TaxID=2650975 RepID=UPI0013016AD4|nr:hypothetical protein [Halorussus halophilus]